MSDKVKKFWTIEHAWEYNPYGRYIYETYEEAEKAAREQAYSNGKAMFVMGQVARAKAPVAVNDVQVEKVKD